MPYRLTLVVIVDDAVPPSQLVATLQSQILPGTAVVSWVGQAPRPLPTPPPLPHHHPLPPRWDPVMVWGGLSVVLLWVAVLAWLLQKT
jgi:hypothetical protein